MADVVVYADVLSDVRYWLRRHPLLTSYHGGRVYRKIPPETAAQPLVWPLIRIYKAGGDIVGSGGTPLETVRVAMDCWGKPDAPGTTPGGEALSQMVLALRSACDRLPSRTLINPLGHTIVVDAAVVLDMESPDPDTGQPRHVVDAQFTVISNQTT